MTAIPKDVRAAVVAQRASSCERCGREDRIGWYADNLCIHHKDRDRSNNSLENLELLCRGCHSRHHLERGESGMKSGVRPRPDLPENGMTHVELRRLLHGAERGQEWLSRRLSVNQADVNAWANARKSIPPRFHEDIRSLLATVKTVVLSDADWDELRAGNSIARGGVHIFRD